MKTILPKFGARAAARSAFSLVEVIFAMAAAAILMVALYDGLSSGFTIIKMARENTRASQIMVEKMETIRLYTWEQVNSNSFLIASFTNYYYPFDTTNRGTMYTGIVTVTNSGLTTSYADDMRKIVVRLDWKTGNLPRTRTSSTYVSRYGLQNYIYY